MFFLQTPPPPPAPEEQAAITKPESSSVMIVHPNQRAKDYIEAFDALRKEHSNARITFTLKDDSTITNVTNIKAMSGGTLLLFQYTSPAGVQYKVVNVESIKSVEHK